MASSGPGGLSSHVSSTRVLPFTPLYGCDTLGFERRGWCCAGRCRGRTGCSGVCCGAGAGHVLGESEDLHLREACTTSRAPLPLLQHCHSRLSQRRQCIHGSTHVSIGSDVSQHPILASGRAVCQALWRHFHTDAASCLMQRVWAASAALACDGHTSFTAQGSYFMLSIR